MDHLRVQRIQHNSNRKTNLRASTFELNFKKKREGKARKNANPPESGFFAADKDGTIRIGRVDIFLYL